TGDVLEMKPTTGSHILEQINEKMALGRLWPWPFLIGGVLSLIVLSQPNQTVQGILSLVATAALTALLNFYDQQRRTIVIMYDLDDAALALFQKLTEAFDIIRSVNQIWNVDTAKHNNDWKRNAGAGQLLTRKAANLT
ncbi:hypothetical protein OEZ84_27765, partial [Leclercia adecarboxylata]|uniref:hypothetical protein n=1 Tax=Leclercia adecarboxylata TaxID=83655 RepID=UPI00234D203E